MRLFVSAHLKLRDVRLHGVVGQLQLDARIAGSALARNGQTHGARVGYEIALPGVYATPLLARFRGRLLLVQLGFPCGELIRFTVIAVPENVVVIENEVRVVEQIDQHGSIGDGQQPDWHGTAVEMLSPGVQGRAQDAAGFPFHYLFVATRIPNGTLAFTTQDINHFLEQVALRLRAASRRDLAHVGVIHSLAALEIEIGAQRSHALPGLHLDSTEVSDAVIPVDRKILLLEPFFKRIDIGLVGIAQTLDHVLLLLGFENCCSGGQRESSAGGSFYKIAPRNRTALELAHQVARTSHLFPPVAIFGIRPWTPFFFSSSSNIALTAGSSSG